MLHATRPRTRSEIAVKGISERTYLLVFVMTTKHPHYDNETHTLVAFYEEK